jgi:protoporphyrinogen oxidase
MYHILGAGISGISAAYHLGLKGKDTVIFEKRNSWGGLCDNFEIEGYRFDYCVHLSFTENQYVKELFSKSAEYFAHKPDPINYYGNKLIKHPAQNNIFPLTIDEKIKVIKGFIERKSKISGAQILNYEKWLRVQYGDYFAENFPLKYTKKYWTVDAMDLTTDWIGNRMYRPTIEEVLYGAFSDETPNTYYAKEMRYPKVGGYKSFIRYMAEKCSIHTNKEISKVDISARKLFFLDGTSENYEYLISSLPLPVLVGLADNVPERVKKASSELLATSITLVSLGFNTLINNNYLWSYFYDGDFLPARAYSPNLKSPDNVPQGCSSLQFEIYYSDRQKQFNEKSSLIDHVVDKATSMGIFDKNEIAVADSRIVEFGNVIFNKQMKKNRNIILKWLDINKIKSIGRFGTWDYLWSDQSLMSGKSIADNI